MSQSATVQAKIALYAVAANTSNTTSQPSAYEAWKSAVVVTLSDAAKAALAAQAAGSSSGVAPINAAPPVDPSQALRDKLDQSIAILNDTSGAASIDDQLAAYAFVNDALMDSAASRGLPDPDLHYAIDLANSAFVQHADQLQRYMQKQGDAVTGSLDPTYFADGAVAIEQRLIAFNGLSADDQKIYLGVEAEYRENAREVNPFKWDQGELYSTSDQYRENLEAQVEVFRALQGAVDDPRYAANTKTIGGAIAGLYDRADIQLDLAQAAGDQQMVDLLSLRDYRETASWTEKAKAYFDKYGPAAPSREAALSFAPPEAFVAKPTQTMSEGGAAMQKMVDAIQTMNDPAATFEAKLDALKTRDASRVSGVVSWISLASEFSQRAEAVQAKFGEAGILARGADEDYAREYQAQLSLFDRMSEEDKALLAHKYNRSPDDIRAGLLDSIEQAERNALLARQNAVDAVVADEAQDDGNSGARRALEILTGDKPFDASAVASLKILRRVSDAQQDWLDNLNNETAPSQNTREADREAEESSSDPKSDKPAAIRAKVDQLVDPPGPAQAERGDVR